MEICLAWLHGRPVMLGLEQGMVSLDGEPMPIKNVTAEELDAFSAEIRAIPFSVDPGYQALLNAKRAELVVSLIGRAVGEDCVNRLSHILDHLHFDVLSYLGELPEED